MQSVERPRNRKRVEKDLASARRRLLSINKLNVDRKNGEETKKHTLGRRYRTIKKIDYFSGRPRCQRMIPDNGKRVENREELVKKTEKEVSKRKVAEISPKRNRKSGAPNPKITRSSTSVTEWHRSENHRLQKEGGPATVHASLTYRTAQQPTEGEEGEA